MRFSTTLVISLGASLAFTTLAGAEEAVLAIAEEAAQASAQGSERTVGEWYALGGFVMHLLVGCSILAGAVFLERLWALRRPAVAPRDLAAKLLAADARRTVELRATCNGSPSALARMVRSGVSAIQRGADHPLDHVALAGEAEAMRLRRNLPLLAALANVATMLGLLGTVLGMIAAFDQISEVGTGDARVVASGIFQALITTAAGLSVGITALAGHAVLRRRVEEHLLTLEQVVQHLFGRDDDAGEVEASAPLEPAASTPR